MSTPEHELPPLQEGYEDEFGRIDPEVYQAASAIWPAAANFGEFALHDRGLASNLMMKAAARVSETIASGKSIENLRGYLLRTFKRLVAREREKTLPRTVPLSEAPDAILAVVDDLDRKVLAREIFARLNDRERSTVEMWMMGYTDAQIAQILDLDSTAVRKRISRFIARTRKTVAD